MPFCRHCGSRASQEALFCGSCGQQIANTSANSPTTAQGAADCDPNSTQIKRKTKPTPAGASVVPGEEKEIQVDLIAPLPSILQQPTAGQIPTISGAPASGQIPTISGAPQATNPPPGSTQGGNSAQHAQAGHAHNASQVAGNHAGASASAGHAAAPQHAAHAGQQAVRHARRFWRIGRRAQEAAHAGAAGASTAASGATVAGTAASSALALKVIVGLVIASVAAASAIKAAPVIFHANAQTSNHHPPVVTVPMPPTQTACPAPGTARAMISKPLAPGSHQDLVFIDGTKVERYDASDGKVTPIHQFPDASSIDAQLSPDGQWLLLVDQIGNQAALQMLRLDGEGLQTLHCAPTGQSIFMPAWSPDQQEVAFNEGTDFTTNPSQNGSTATTLLQLSTGKIQTLLTQSPGSFVGLGYVPLAWSDNTHLVMKVVNADSFTPVTLSLLNISQGANQSINLLQQVAMLDDPITQHIVLNPEHKDILVNSCTCGFNKWRGPSGITEQSAGGNKSVVYTDQANAITNLAMSSQNELLAVITNTEGDLSQNGLWKINLVNKQAVRLMANTYNGEADILFNAHTLSPWGNISRDSRMYAVEVLNYTTQHVDVFLGFMQGNGSLKTLMSIPYSNNNPVSFSIVGWTTM